MIGVEFATIFQALCSHVTIIESREHLLGPMDNEVSEVLEEELRRKGISVQCEARVLEIRGEEQGLVCVYEAGGAVRTIRSGQILLAAGRQPTLDGLFG